MTAAGSATVVRCLRSSAAPEGDRHAVVVPDADLDVDVAILGSPGGRPLRARCGRTPPHFRGCDPRPPRRTAAGPFAGTAKAAAPLKDVVDDAAYLALTFGSAETDLGREGFHIYCMIGSARQPKSPLAPRP